MVYATRLEDRTVTLGVSGRLLRGNLLMWDEESDSLWSQILGEGIHGAEKGARLEMMPAVFLGFATWKRMHPETVVLDLPSVRQEAWHFTTESLAEDRGDGGEPLGIGLRFGGDTLLVPMKRLQREGSVTAQVGGVPVLLVWHARERAALVYERTLDGVVWELALEGDQLVVPTGEVSFDALTGACRTKNAPPGLALRRFSYVPTHVSAWRDYYPTGRVEP